MPWESWDLNIFSVIEWLRVNEHIFQSSTQRDKNKPFTDLTCLSFSLAPMLFQIHTQQSLSNTIMLLLTLKTYDELSDLKCKLKD